MFEDFWITRMKDPLLYLKIIAVMGVFYLNIEYNIYISIFYEVLVVMAFVFVQHHWPKHVATPILGFISGVLFLVPVIFNLTSIKDLWLQMAVNCVIGIILVGGYAPNLYQRYLKYMENDSSSEK